MMPLSDIGNQTFTGVDLAILFFAAVGVLDRFRRQRQHLAHVRVNDHRLQNLVIVVRAVFGGGSQTARAVNSGR
jgi:hypothetical protein